MINGLRFGHGERVMSGSPTVVIGLEQWLRLGHPPDGVDGLCVPTTHQEDVVSNGSSVGGRLSRGDRRRNEKLARLRAVVTRESAVLAFDLAADKQVCALTDCQASLILRIWSSLVMRMVQIRTAPPVDRAGRF